MPSLHLRPSGLDGNSKELVKPDNGDEKPFFLVNDQVTGTEIKKVQEEIKKKASKLHNTHDEDVGKDRGTIKTIPLRAGRWIVARTRLSYPGTRLA